MTKAAANLIVRAVHGRKRLNISSSTVQRCCFSQSAIRREAPLASAPPIRGIPLADDLDGIKISSSASRGKRNRSRFDPTKPIRSESEFPKDTLVRDLAAHRIQNQRKAPARRTFDTSLSLKEEEEIKEMEGTNVDRVDISNPPDIAPMRRTRKPDRMSQHMGDAADAALRSFQQSEANNPNRPSRRSRRVNRSDTAKSVDTAHVIAADESPSTVDLADDEEATAEDVPPPKESSDPVSRPSPLMQVFDGDNFAVQTPFNLQSPDPDIVSPIDDTMTQILSEPLTTLNPQFFLDADIDAQMKEHVGRYDTYFRTQNWESADKPKSGKALSPLEYASLTIAHNSTLGSKKKKQSVNTIKRVLQRVPQFVSPLT